jgi:hypothetical protein
VARCASKPRPDWCWRCVENLRYAITRSMIKGHTTVCPLDSAELSGLTGKRSQIGCYGSSQWRADPSQWLNDRLSN